MKTVKSFFDHLCRVYTISAMLFLLLNLAIAGTLENTIINARSFLLVFLFAVGFALANVIYTSQFSTAGLRLAMHFVLVTMSAFLFLCLPAKTSGGASGRKRDGSSTAASMCAWWTTGRSRASCTAPTRTVAGGAAAER